MRTLLMLAILGLGICPAASAQQAATPELTVGTVQAVKQPISKSLAFVGRVEAIERVEIVARVSGYLEEVLFTEGATVKQGDPLYHIEKGLLQAEVQQAQGNLESSKAAVVLAQQQKSRASDLVKKQVGTVVSLDQATAAVQSASGSVQTAQGNLETAQINLGYADIASPITGRIDRTAVTKGNVVGPNSGILTVIVSQDPIYVTFPVSQREFLRAREAGTQTNADAIKVRLRFSDGTVYPEPGKINFVAATTDRATDTITVRAVFPNAKGTLVDGQLVNVDLESSTPTEMVVVPQASLLADQTGPYLFVVEDDKAVVKRVKLGAESGPNIVVTEGLSGGELVIVEGLQALRPNLPVKAAPIAAPSDPS